jgi:hypothetical protein
MTKAMQAKALVIPWQSFKTEVKRRRHRVFIRMPQKQTTYIQQSSISSEIRKRALFYIKTRPIKMNTKKMVYLQTSEEES